MLSNKTKTPSHACFIYRHRDGVHRGSTLLGSYLLGRSRSTPVTWAKRVNLLPKLVMFPGSGHMLTGAFLRVSDEWLPPGPFSLVTLAPCTSPVQRIWLYAVVDLCSLTLGDDSLQAGKYLFTTDQVQRLVEVATVRLSSSRYTDWHEERFALMTGFFLYGFE